MHDPAMKYDLTPGIDLSSNSAIAERQWPKIGKAL